MTRADLARIPACGHPAELLALQAEAPPFGGLAAAHARPALPRVLRARRAADARRPRQGLVGHGPRAVRGRRAKRARFPCSIVLPTTYRRSAICSRSARGRSAARSCPLARADLARKVDAIRRLQPRFFSGTGRAPESDLLDHAETAELVATSLENGAGRRLRDAGQARGAASCAASPCATPCMITPELGADRLRERHHGRARRQRGADRRDRRSAHAPARGRGQRGRARCDAHQPSIIPLLRLRDRPCAASSLPQFSTCGRTNMRIACPREMRPSSVEVGEACVHISQIREIAARPSGGRPDARVYTSPARHVTSSCSRSSTRAERNRARRAPARDAARHHPRRRHGRARRPPARLADDDALLVDERPLNWPPV